MAARGEAPERVAALIESRRHLVLRSAEGASRRTFQKAALLGRMLDRPSTRRLAPPAQDEVEVRIPNRNTL
jgi:hypothetical protein